MSFPWEPAIPQAMQQHGGRSRPVVRKATEAVGQPDAPHPAVDAPGLVPSSEADARQPSERTQG